MKIKIILFILLSFLNVTVSSGQKNNKKVIISGIVSDSLRRPLAGVLILIDGKPTDSFTSTDGVFRLKVRSDADSITILAPGNQITTVPIMGRTRIDFILGLADRSLQSAQNKDANENQVDVGYGTARQKDLLTPVSKIEVKGNKYAAYKDIYEILKGTPGVIVRGRSVQINGPSSLNSGTEPLYVVDGTTVESVDGINPATVERISVLKGSSTAIYGSRGANGVILITLHKNPEKK
jgi:TonB-dependent SusC/RagA subfamily outer membrane receptor